MADTDLDAAIKSLNEDINKKVGPYTPPVDAPSAPATPAQAASNAELDAAIKAANEDITKQVGPYIPSSKPLEDNRGFPYGVAGAHIGTVLPFASDDKGNLKVTPSGWPELYAPELIRSAARGFEGFTKRLTGPLEPADLHGLSGDEQAALYGLGGLAPSMLGVRSVAGPRPTFLPKDTLLKGPKTAAVENALRSRYPDEFAAKDGRLADDMGDVLNEAIDTYVPRYNGRNPPMTPDQLKALTELNQTMGGDGRVFEPDEFVRKFRTLKPFIRENLPEPIMDEMQRVHDHIATERASRSIPPAEIDYSQLGNGAIRRTIGNLSNSLDSNPYQNIYTYGHALGAYNAFMSGGVYPWLANVGLLAARGIGKGVARRNIGRNEEYLNALKSKYLED